MRTEATRKGRILGVRVVTRWDDMPDTSYLGKYTDTPEEGAIVCATGEFWEDANEIPNRSRECRFFRPYAGGEAVQSESYRAYAKQDWERMRDLSGGEWEYVGIMAEAEVTLAGSNVIQRITSGGCGGLSPTAGTHILRRWQSRSLRSWGASCRHWGLANGRLLRRTQTPRMSQSKVTTKPPARGLKRGQKGMRS